MTGDAMDRLKQALGPAGWIDDARDMAPYLADMRGIYPARSPLVARPKSAPEVAAVIKICAEAGVGVVPQGGNTGLVGGSVPSDSGTEIVLNLGRMHKIRAIDAANNTITVEAGCVLADIQAAAARADRLFPLSLAAEGSCQIGGNLSTNAGGTGVLRYGNARDLALGLEVVLPDGRLWDGLKGLRKDNSGYDLKQLFIGAEGTLGVITAAAFRLMPLPRVSSTSCGVTSQMNSPATTTTTTATSRGVRGVRCRRRPGVSRHPTADPGSSRRYSQASVAVMSSCSSARTAAVERSNKPLVWR